MTTITQTGALTPAQAAAQAAVASTLPSSGSSSGAASTASGGSAALSTLGSNFNDFLNLLMTQLKNQDPTSPMDSNQFTTELVQFTGVQQQVSTNSSLSQLIGLTQQSQMLTASQYVGQKATVTSTAIALQNGTGQISFTGQSGESVGIAIVDASGGLIRSATVTAQDGTNSWTWDGKDDQGNTMPDGAYRIGVEAAAGNAPPVAIPFDVIGTATGVTSNGTLGLMLSMGALSVGLASVQSVSAK